MTGPLRGQCLIASQSLRDANFYKAIVLIVEQSSDGAMGLILNRPSPLTVEKALAGHFKFTDQDQLVYTGGPVEPNGLFVLHSDAESTDDLAVIPGVHVGGSVDAFRNVFERIEEGRSIRFRIFAGCSGWASNQLEGEIERGDWFVIPATKDFVWSDDPYMLYENVLQRHFEAHRILPHNVKDPTWN